jgi:hypothetical protein
MQHNCCSAIFCDETPVFSRSCGGRQTGVFDGALLAVHEAGAAEAIH